MFPLCRACSPPLALRLNAGFVPVRKAKKLPGDCHKVTYSLEYGEDAFEIQKDSIKEGQTVLIVDDLIATGGSASAAGKLVKMAGGKTVEYLFVVGLPFLNGHKKLDGPAYCQYTLTRPPSCASSPPSTRTDELVASPLFSITILRSRPTFVFTRARRTPHLSARPRARLFAASGVVAGED